MTWAKFCDGFLDHPKVLRAGEDAANLFMRGCIWCNKHLTDGAIPREALRALTARRDAPALAARLVAVRLWEETPDGWQVHDWRDHNPTREAVEGKREKTREKVAAWREKRAKTAVSDECNHGRNRVTCEVCNPVGNPAPDPTRPDPTTYQSTPNGVLPPQPPAGGAPAVEPPPPKRKAAKVDTAPHGPGTREADVAGAIARWEHLAGLVSRPNALAAAALTSFPALDVVREVDKAGGWCVANPDKAPRSKGDAFLWSWLQRAHDRASRGAAATSQRDATLFDAKPAPVARAVRPGDIQREALAHIGAKQ